MQPQASTTPAMTTDAAVAPTLVPADVASSPAQDAHAVAPTLASSIVELPTPSTTREDAASQTSFARAAQRRCTIEFPMVTVQLGQRMIQVAGGDVGDSSRLRWKRRWEHPVFLNAPRR